MNKNKVKDKNVKKKTYHTCVLFNKSITELIGSKINLNFKKLNLIKSWIEFNIIITVSLRKVIE